MATPRFAGPVDYLVFAFQEGSDVGAGLSAALARVDQGLIEILDIEFVSRQEDGSPTRVAFSDMSHVAGTALAPFEGATSDIMDEDDLGTIASALEPGQIAVAIIYEDRCLAAAAEAWIEAGGVELFSGGVDLADLESSLAEGTPS